MAPIVLFVYNRPWHTQQTVEALQHCVLAAESDLYIFADGPKADASEEQKNKILEIHNYIHAIDGFHSVTIEEAETNKGLANSIISGVTKVIEKHGKAIVVEDDIVSHPFFLRFMNAALDFYENDERVFCVSATMENFPIPSAYTYDVFLTYRAGSWGWGIWGDRWKTIDWDMENYPIIQHPTRDQIKKFCRGGDDLWPMLQAQQRGVIDSWAIRWNYNMSCQNKFCLRPTKSLVSNIGMDGSGKHCGFSDVRLLPLYDDEHYGIQLFREIKETKAVTRAIQSVFRHHEVKRVGPMKCFKRFIKRTGRKLFG